MTNHSRDDPMMRDEDEGVLCRNAEETPKRQVDEDESREKIGPIDIDVKKAEGKRGKTSRAGGK